MPANAQQTDFDIAAATWDDDPVKVARAQAVAAGIRRQVPWRAGMTALELGCGTGLLSFMLQHDLEQITLADSSSGMLAVLGKKIAAAGVASMRPFKVDLEMDSLPDERFDLVYSLMTFHHVQDTDRLLHSLFSLLKPAGHLCVADLDREDGSFHGPGFTGRNGFDRDNLAQRAVSAGFRNVVFETVFDMRKSVNGATKSYPVFLMVARVSQ